MSNKNDFFICPKCGAILFPYEVLFLHMGDIKGCEDCYVEEDWKDKEDWPEETLTVREYLNQGQVSDIDHKIDDLKENR